MNKMILIVPSATYRASDFVGAAERLEVELVVASERRPAMAAAMGDRSVVIDLDAVEASADLVADAARRAGDVAAVVGVDDQGIVIAARAAELLGLPHSPLDAVAATRDKAAMRAAFDAAGLPQPRWRLLTGADHAGSVAAGLGFPCVVKPLSLSASRGVIRVDSASEADAAAVRVRKILEDADEDCGADLLVERFVRGGEVALEGLVVGGRLEVLALFDKPDPLEGPYFEETIYVTPSRLPSALRRDIAETAQRAVAALGLTEGPVHAEMRLPEDDVVILEVAARSIGGLCSRALRFGAAVSLEEIILRHALGRGLDDLRLADRAAGVMMIPIPRAGVLSEVRGKDAARAVPGISGLVITAPVGAMVTPLPEGDRYLGFLFARADAPGEVEEALRRAHACLDVAIEPAD